MISNYQFIIDNYQNIVNYPFLASILPILFTGLIYLLGKLRVSNYWQYHLDNKYTPFLHGIAVINNFVFIPLVILAFVYYTIFESKALLSLGFISIIILVIILNIIQGLGKQLIKWEKDKDPVNTVNHLLFNLNLITEILTNWKAYLNILLLKVVFPLALYLSIYLVLKNTSQPIVLVFVTFVWLLALMFFAITDTIIEKHKLSDIRLTDKQCFKNAKIIEFLNDGAFIKFQSNDSVIRVIPTEKIAEIIMR